MSSNQLPMPTYYPSDVAPSSSSSCSPMMWVLIAVVIAMVVATISVLIAVAVKNNNNKTYDIRRPYYPYGHHHHDGGGGGGGAPPAPAAGGDGGSAQVKNGNMQRARMMHSARRPDMGRKDMAYVYPPTQYQEPIYDAPAPMPQSQLMQPQMMAVKDVYLPGVPSSSSIIGEAQMDIMTTENAGTSIDAFQDNNYLMDPGMMTPGGATDVMGLQTFMPYMGGGVGENDSQNDGSVGGPVDPNTGLPLFTTGKLIRSQLLGGHGAGSFLRQVQDPLSGYRKSIGKNLCGVQQARRDVEIRRKQLNAARLEHPDADPILFNTSDFAYN